MAIVALSPGGSRVVSQRAHWTWNAGLSNAKIALVIPGHVLTPTENRAPFARRVLGLAATLHQNSECGDYGATWT